MIKIWFSDITKADVKLFDHRFWVPAIHQLYFVIDGSGPYSSGTNTSDIFVKFWNLQITSAPNGPELNKCSMEMVHEMAKILSIAA